MTTIKLKNGSGAPTAGDLVQGEPALDLTNKRLYTEDSGGTVIEVGTNPGTDVTFADNRKAIFGAGSDLQIYHDGSNSYIDDQGTGGLYVRSSSNMFLTAANGEKYFRGTVNGAATLYYDDAEKLATTSTGIDVTGTAVTDGATIAGTLELDSNNFDHTAATPQYNMIESDVTGNNTQFLQTAGDLRIRTVDDSLANPVERLRIDHATGDISFYEDTGTTAKLFWDASTERLGIGNTSPATTLDVSGTVTADGLTVDGNATITGNAGAGNFGVTLRNDDGAGHGVKVRGGNNTSSVDSFVVTKESDDSYVLKANSTGDISFYEDTGTTAKLFWDASAESLGIGTSSPATRLHSVGAEGEVARIGSGSVAFSLGVGHTGNGTGYLNLFPTSSPSTSPTSLAFQMGGTERMRIDSSGNLLVGTTSVNGTGVTLGAGNYGYFNRSGDAALFADRGSNNGDCVEFRRAGTKVGSVSVSGTNATFNTSSDQRLKDNIVDAPSASDDIDAIQVRSFDWKADGSHQKYGMVAQELQSVAPEAVSVGETEEDMMGVDYSKLVPMMMKEIQSLRARVAQLEGAN